MKPIEKAYHLQLRKHASEAKALIPWLDAELKKANCCFGQDVIPCFIKPYFLSEKEALELGRVTGILGHMLEKIIHAYFQFPELQTIFGLTRQEKHYVEMDPGYSKSIIISRPDGFWTQGRMQFIEFNCDSPAGSGYSDVQEKIIRKSFSMKELRGKYTWKRSARLEQLLQALLRCWKEFGPRRHPNIAIVDWKNLRTFPEFEITRDYFKSKGYHTVIADPRELKLKSGRLYYGKLRIDLVYRRVIFKELWEKRKEVMDLFKAYRLGKVCVVNPFRSRLAANKSVLSILTNPVHDHLFSQEEIKTREKHIPWTRRVIDAKKFYGGQNHLLTELIDQHQENLVLKPAEGYGGRDVFIGKETSRSEWRRIMHRALRGGERWVVQEYVSIPEMKVPVLHKKRVRLVSKKVNLNPFVFGGRYAGSMARLSDHSVINVSAGGGLIPAITYRSQS